MGGGQSCMRVNVSLKAFAPPSTHSLADRFPVWSVVNGLVYVGVASLLTEYRNVCMPLGRHTARMSSRGSCVHRHRTLSADRRRISRSTDDKLRHYGRLAISFVPTALPWRHTDNQHHEDTPPHQSSALPVTPSLWAMHRVFATALRFENAHVRDHRERHVLNQPGLGHSKIS